MFVLDEDRDQFYCFIRNHLKPNGIALVLSMGDGMKEYCHNGPINEENLC